MMQSRQNTDDVPWTDETVAPGIVMVLKQAIDMGMQVGAMNRLLAMLWR